MAPCQHLRSVCHRYREKWLLLIIARGNAGEEINIHVVALLTTKRTKLQKAWLWPWAHLSPEEASLWRGFCCFMWLFVGSNIDAPAPRNCIVQV